MPIPSQPQNPVIRPFASEGNFQIIPDTTTNSGRASYTQGFPIETQRPLSAGGVAPNRLDFNGILNILTGIGFWQQSGGQWTYETDRNYKTPCLVYYDDKLWWCLQENGPDSTNGLVAPGTNEAYWEEFLTALAEMGGGTSFGNPVGAIIAFYGTSAPDGYLPCDASTYDVTTYPVLYSILGSNTTPDMRGLFIRGYDPGGVRDPNGTTRGIGSIQLDAMQNITADWSSKPPQNGNNAALPAPSGAAYNMRSGGGAASAGGQGAERIGFDASRQVRTSTENRPVNISLLYCIKHD